MFLSKRNDNGWTNKTIEVTIEFGFRKVPNDLKTELGIVK
jgi:hypothetical protein